jgi:hypothetical protein
MIRVEQEMCVQTLLETSHHRQAVFKGRVYLRDGCRKEDNTKMESDNRF